MDGWNTSFLFGWPIFRGYLSFGEGIPFPVGNPFKPSFVTVSGWRGRPKSYQRNCTQLPSDHQSKEWLPDHCPLRQAQVFFGKRPQKATLILVVSFRNFNSNAKFSFLKPTSSSPREAYFWTSLRHLPGMNISHFFKTLLQMVENKWFGTGHLITHAIFFPRKTNEGFLKINGWFGWFRYVFPIVQGKLSPRC